MKCSDCHHEYDPASEPHSIGRCAVLRYKRQRADAHHRAARQLAHMLPQQPFVLPDLVQEATEALVEARAEVVSARERLQGPGTDFWKMMRQLSLENAERKVVELEATIADRVRAVQAYRERLVPATPENAGITETHLRCITEVCRAQNTFLFIRPSTQATRRLIDQGFATKSMDVHDKSCDWGLAAGFVPIDQAFCKKLADGPTKRHVPDEDLEGHAHGEAVPVQLILEQKQFEQLHAAGHFEHAVARPASARCRELDGHDHFHCDDKAADVPGIGAGNAATSTCLLRERATGAVFWQWRDGRSDAKVPLAVWGYDDVAVTGDYDMWMVCPHIEKVQAQPEVNSVKDAHGRSAATRFTVDLIAALNRACRPSGPPVFNHGAEAQNYSFTQELDPTLVVFCPGSAAPFLAKRAHLPAVLHDIGCGGYVATRNPKWSRGMTLGIEDMAWYADAPIDVARKAVQPLRESAAVAIQRAWRKRNGKPVSADPKPLDALRGRLELMWPMRVLRAGLFGRRDDPVLLTESHFYPRSFWNRSATRERARDFAQLQESAFRRTGFVVDDGAPTPLDKT